jgi:hypothetical protein
MQPSHTPLFGFCVALTLACTGFAPLGLFNDTPANDTPATPSDETPAMMTPCPTFATQVLPVLEAKCQVCHQGPLAPGGFFIGGRGDVVGSAVAIAQTLASGRMPPNGASPLGDLDRSLLGDWLKPHCFAATTTDKDFTLPNFSTEEILPTRLSPLRLDNTLFQVVQESLQPARALSGTYEVAGPASIDSTAFSELRSFARTVSQRIAQRERIDGFRCSDGQTAPARCTSEALVFFAQSLFRGMVDPEQVTALQTLRSEAESLSSPTIGLASALEALLMSPQFLYQLNTAQPQLRQLELASRLSYFLRDSPPSDELLSLARNNQLSTGASRAKYIQSVYNSAETPEHGFLASYFLGNNFDVLLRSRIETIAERFWYMWRGTTDKDPELLEGGAVFSVVWDTFIEAPETGDYEFHIGCGAPPGGAQPLPHRGSVMFEGMTLAAGEQCKSYAFWNQLETQGFRFVRALQKGRRYRLVVEGQGWPGETAVYMAWKPPNRPKQTIPRDFLFAPPEASMRGVMNSLARLGGYSELAKRTKDAMKYPLFDEKLRSHQRQQADAVVGQAMLDAQPGLLSLLNRKELPLNDLTATSLGLGASQTVDRRFVNRAVPPEHQAGWLSSPAVFAGNSGPLHASFVKMGMFVRNKMMCLELPPPPPGVEVNVDATVPGAFSLAEKLRLHSSQATCNGCHRNIDPVGIPFMRYDSLGRFIGDAEGIAPDAGGVFAESGVRFSSLPQLSEALTTDVRVARCLASRILETATDSPRRERFRNDIETAAVGLSTMQLSLQNLVIQLLASDSFETP